MSTTTQQPFRFFNFLSLLSLTIIVASTSVAYKPVHIWKFTATSSSLLFATTFALSSIIAEVYGKDIAKRLVHQLIICGLLFSFIVSFIPLLPAPANWHHQEAYDYVFGFSYRFALFGTLGSLLSYRINIWLITHWQTLVHGKYFPLRIIGANTIGEFFLVTITTIGSFYGVYPWDQVLSMLIFAILSKIVFSLILSWPAALLAYFIKKHEQL